MLSEDLEVSGFRIYGIAKEDRKSGTTKELSSPYIDTSPQSRRRQKPRTLIPALQEPSTPKTSETLNPKPEILNPHSNQDPSANQRGLEAELNNGRLVPGHQDLEVLG